MKRRTRPVGWPWRSPTWDGHEEGPTSSDFARAMRSRTSTTPSVRALGPREPDYAPPFLTYRELEDLVELARRTR